MQTTRTALFLAAALFSLNAAAEDTLSIDSTREVAYTCNFLSLNDNKEHPIHITAMYGIKDNQVILAQLKIGKDITPGLFRDDFPVMNRFVSIDPEVKTMAWTTMPATAEEITEVNGGKLSVESKAGGQHDIMLDNCKLNRAATAKLNKK